MELTDLGGNIRAELARRRKTQRGLLEKLGVSKQTLNRSLNGTRPFRINELAIIADYLEVQVSDLTKAAA